MVKKNKLLVVIGIVAALMTVLYFSVFAGSQITVELNKSSISENMEVGSLVGTLTVSGTGTIQAVTLKNGEGSSDPNFNLVMEEGVYKLVTNAVFDFEKTNSYTVSVSVTDEEKTEDKSLTVSVTNVDEVAPIAEDSSASTNEDEELKDASVKATDIVDSSGTLTYEVVTNVSHGILLLNKADGTYTYTPAAEFSGSDSFTFKASDGANDSNTATVTITVNAVNDGPKNTDKPTVTGTNFHAGDKLTTTNGTWNDVDSETSKLSYSYQWQTATDDKGVGVADITDAKSSTYSLVSKDGGKYIRVKVSCTDDGGAKADANSDWKLVENAMPVIKKDDPSSMSFIEDGAAQDLTFSSSDSDGDSLTWSISKNASKGNLTLDGSKVTYAPKNNENGADSFEVSVSDGCATDSITVNVTIDATNDLPVNGTKPSFSGTMKTGGVLTVDKGTWTDAEDAADKLSYSYRWQIAPNGTTNESDITDITSETAVTYTVKASDKGKYIRVKVTCKDSELDKPGETVAYSDWASVGNTAPVIKKDDPSSLSFIEDGAAQDLTFTASDADSDALTWSVSTPTKGTAVLVGSKVTYTPTANENGSDSFVVRVTDGTDTDTINVSVSITVVNDEPSFTDIVDQTVLEDCGAQTVANCTTGSKGAANEIDQTLTYTVTSDNDNLFSAKPAISPTGTLTYTPKANAYGEATVSVTLSDNGGTDNKGDDTSATKTFKITITEVNDTPTFTKGGDQTFAEDCGEKTVAKWATSIYIGPEDETPKQTYSFLVTTNNDALFKVLPAIDTNGNLTFTPADNANGNATVTVYLKDYGDGANTSAAATFTISIAAENDIPTLTGDDTISTDEDVAYIYHFTVRDIEDAAGSLAISWDTSDTSLLTKANMVLGGSGTDRTLTLTPVADHSGKVNVTLSVKDSSGLSVTKTVAFTVNTVNDAPVISAIADRTINEDTSSGAIGFAISDVDSTLGACEVTVTSSDQSVVENKDIVLGGSGANRTITLTPLGNSSGETTITVKVNDKSGAANAETMVSFKVTVNSVDDAPTIDDIADVIINEDHDTGDILFNVVDVDDTLLTVSASTNNTAMIPKANLIVTKVNDKHYKVKAIPVANKFGTATITVSVKDPSGLIATDSFVLTVNSENDLPTLSAVADQTTNEDSVKTVSLTISDVETAVGSLTVVPISSSNEDIITTDKIAIPGTGAARTMTLTPVKDAHGTSDITIRVTDGDGGYAERTFKLTVSSVNDAPSFAKGADISEPEDCGAKLYDKWAENISAGPQDETATENQTVSFAVSNDNNSLFSVQPSISPDGTLSFTSAADANGYATVTVTAKDSVIPAASSDSQTFKITLNAVNDAPVAHNMTKVLDTDENQSYRGYLVGTDVDKDALKFSITTQPTNGTVTISNADTGAFQYTPNTYFNGDDTFKFKVNDGKADSGEATVTMKVLGVNDPPVAAGFNLSVNEDDTTTFDLSLPAHSSDIDSDPTKFTYSIPLNPDHGTITHVDKGQFTYKPNGNYFGSDVFTFKVTDDQGLSSNTAMVYVTVSPVNDKPLAMNESITLSENQTLNGVFKASDLENDALTYSIVSGPDASAGTLTMAKAEKGTYTFVPKANFKGTATFAFQAAEKSTPENSSEGTVTVTIKPVNNAPEVTGTPPIEFTTLEDTEKEGNVSASDPDGDTLTYSLISRPKHGSLAGDKIDPLNGAFKYTPENNYNGTDFFTAQAVDPSGLYTSIVLVKITVNAADDPCSAYDQWIETAYNKAVSGYLAGYDADGDSLSYSLVGTPVGGTVELDDAATGKFTFTPTADTSGAASFQYMVSDKASTSLSATVHITVYGSGGSGSSYTVGGISDRNTPEDTAITVPITTTGMTLPEMTAASSNGDLLASIDIVKTDKGDGKFEFALTMTPKLNQTGKTVISLTFTYDTNKTLTRTFVLTVGPVNDDPIKDDKSITIDENKYVYDFVVASDVDDSSLTYTHTELSNKNSKLTFNSDGSFKYEPETNWYGADSFKFTATDKDGKYAEGTISITVRQVSRAPVANSGSFTTNEDTSYTSTDETKLSAVDYNSEALKYEIVSNGSLGTATLTDASTGKFTYVPKDNLSGSDSFTFKVIGQSSGLESGTAIVSITIDPLNDAPTAVIKQVDTNEDQAVNGRLQASDVEKDTISYNLTGGAPSSGSDYTAATLFGTIKLNQTTGDYTYTPKANANGADSFTFKLKDSGNAESSEYKVNIIVASINDAPVAKDDTIHVNEDSFETGSLKAFYSDVDTGDTHTSSLSQSPAKGTVSFDAEGNYTYTPTANINGIDYFSFKVTDKGGLSSNVAQITVIIDPINDAPKMTAAAGWTVNEDSSNNKFTFTVSDIEDAAGVLTLSGTSSDQSKIPDSNISFTNTNGNCIMTVTPVGNALGPVNITIRTTDSGKDGTLDPPVKKYVEQTVTVSVEEVNDTPTISGLNKAVVTDEDVNTAPVSFTVVDEESTSDKLTVTGASNNSALINTINITKGTDGSCSVTVTPKKDQFGSARVTISVSDGKSSRSQYLDVTVNPVNDAPVVTPPADQTINEDTGTETLYYTISDIDSNIENIEMTASASDNSKISSITLGGNGADRTVKVIPAKDATGDVTITLRADDKSSLNNTDTGSFVVHISPVNDAPTIGTIDDQVTDEDISKNDVLFSIGDIDSDLSKMTFSAVSGNTSLIKSADITFTTVDGKRYVNMKPVADANGSALITVTVSDGTKTASTSFKLTVNPVNDAPKISDIANQNILEGSATGIITFNISDIDNDVVTELTVTQASTDEGVIPLSGIVMTGSGSERTVKVTPLADGNGNIKVTLTVVDKGGLTASDDFYVNITPVNDAPSFTKGNDITVNEDSGAYSNATAWAKDLSKGPSNESVQTLTFAVANDKNGLFSTQPAIDANGKLTFTLAADANGSSKVTVYLQDSGDTTNGGVNKTSSVTFTIKVNEVNDAPSFAKISEDPVVVNEDTSYSAAWATSLNKGAINESSQTLAFVVSNVINSTLFSTQPKISSTGVLTFKPKDNANGEATVTVRLKDSGGTANGGVDTTAEVTFEIKVTAVNDAPTIAVIDDQTTLEDTAKNGVAISIGDVDSDVSSLTLSAASSNTNVLTTGGITFGGSGSSRTISMNPFTNANGTASVTITVSDGTKTATRVFVLTVTAVNDAPSFNKGADISVNEDSGAYSNATAWAKDLSKGPSNESGQALTFTVTNDKNGLFSAQPAIDDNGKLTFTPAANAYGEANVKVTLKDSGGTAHSGVDTSAEQTFKITVNPVNDAPEFTMATETTVLEDCVAQTVKDWDKDIKTGPDNESTQKLSEFTVSNNNTELFSAQPAISADGTLAFTPTANVNGDATVTVKINDDGGTVSGGLDSTTKTFIIHVTPVNDAPSFTLPDKDPTKDADVTVGVDTGDKTYTGWTDDMSKGPDNESGQTLTFTLTTDNDTIFKTLPTIDAATGKLSFEPSETTSGTAKVTVTLKDNGGTANGGKDSASAEFKIRVMATSELKLTGTIYDAADGTTKISGATVNLLNMDGTKKATFTTKADGKYEFDGLAVSKYMIEVKKDADGYNPNTRITDVAFDKGDAGVIIEDFKLAKFKLILTANPQKILGDGKSTTKLTATVTNSAGKPIDGVNLTFSAATTKKPFSDTKPTGADGKATTTFTSDELTGTTQLLIPIMVTVNDTENNLYGSDWIYEYFVPGFVEGVVRDGNGNPIKDAIVTVYKDYNGDNIIGPADFSDTQITGSEEVRELTKKDGVYNDGAYKIAIPEGNVEYEIRITKRVTIGKKEEDITVSEKVSVGKTGEGEKYEPEIAASGVAVLENADGSASIVNDKSPLSSVTMRIVDVDGKLVGSLNKDAVTGVFKATGLEKNKTYTVEAVYTLKGEDGKDKQIVIGSSTVTISSTGEMNISQVLIDPYGTITDTNTKKLVEGAEVKLFYADTAKNKKEGITPNTKVILPSITGFAPHDNKNPQNSDANGFYAFMVFPDTDYYIVATKSGYATYTSPTISVGAAIVNWDFEMTPNVAVVEPEKAENDLAIEVSSDKMKVEEGTNATLTVQYKNKSSAKVSDYTVTVTVPNGMTVTDAAGGAITGSKIIWTGVDFPAGEVKSLKIVLSASTLSAKEQSVTVKADITSTTKLVNTSDDTSSINLMLYSNRFEGSHKRYIRGYPDGTFGPSRNITRAETAAIFARLLDLDVSNTATSYTDIDSASWAAGYISAVSNYGLMKGYVDGTFLPDKAITRAEFATIAARYFNIERSNSVTAIDEHFSDIADSWAKSTICEVYRYSIINGYADGTFKPNNSISRAEAVTMVNRMLYRGPVSTDKNLFTDISTSDWFFGQVVEASASHSYSINPDSTETVVGWIEDEMK